MTKEAKELLAHLCRDGVWAKERDMTEELEETLDLIQGGDFNLFIPLQGFCTVGRRFSTEQECEDFSDAVNDLRPIEISYAVETGAGGENTTGHLFGPALVHGTDFFIQVNRAYLFVLMPVYWFWENGQGGIIGGDFIDFLSRDGEKYWDCLTEPVHPIYTDGKDDSMVDMPEPYDDEREEEN